MKALPTAARAVLLIALAGIMAISATAVLADTIVKWDFETGVNPPPGGSTAVIPYANFVAPSVGTGTLSVGGPTPPVTADAALYVGPIGKSWYFSGNPGLAWSISPLAYLPDTAQPISATNPPEGDGYMRFNTSTAGWQDISVRFDLRCTSTSPNRARLQYTVNGSTWTDFVDPIEGNPFVTSTAAATWKNFTFNMSGVAALNDKAGFGFRIVPALDPSTGSWKAVSAAAPASGGNYRLDNVTVTGNTLGSVGPTPSISAPSASATIIDPVTYTVTFDEPVTGFDNSSDVLAETTGSASVSVGVAEVAGSDHKVYTVTVTPSGGTGGVSITVPQNVCNAITGGSPNKSSAPSASFQMVNEPRATWSGSPTPSITKSGPVTLTVNFNVPVTDFLTADDITILTVDGSVTVGTVTVTGNTDPTPFIGPYTVTLSDISGNGLVQVRVKANAAYNNGIGNLESFSSSNIKVIQSSGIVTQWTFDSVPSDAAVTTGTTNPAIGSGTASMAAGMTSTYATGIPNAGSNSDNSGWNTVPFGGIPQGVGDPAFSPTNPLPKTRYAQFALSTVGFTDIVVVFDQQYSNSSPNTTVFQYTTDGTAWTDVNTFTAAGGNQYTRVVPLPAGAEGKPAFAIRMAADVDPTTLDYKAANNANTLTNTGTWRFDNVTIYGNIGLGGDAPIGSLTGKPDGTLVALCSKVLYLKQGTYAYVEELQRASGIRLEGSVTAAEGATVCLTGSLQTTAGGERYVLVDQMSTGTSGAVLPVAVNNRTAKTTLVGGLKVTVFGTVKEGSVTGSSFVITDGSDDTGVKVITQGAPGVSAGAFVVVTGAAGYDGERVIYKQ